MAKAKTATKKSTSRKTATKKSTSRKSTNEVEARPIGQGKDPLAEGERLYNETNTEAETHYKADDSELKAEENASKIRGLDANERAELHNAESEPLPSDEVVANDSETEAEVAAADANRSGR